MPISDKEIERQRPLVIGAEKKDILPTIVGLPRRFVCRMKGRFQMRKVIWMRLRAEALDEVLALHHNRQNENRMEIVPLV